MLQKRGHAHALQRDAHPLAPAVHKRRIVTFYTTVTSSGWTGGDLTTLPPANAAPAEAAPTVTPGFVNRIADTSPTTLPSAISATEGTADVTGPLVAQSVLPSTSRTSTSPTMATTSSTNSAAAASATSPSTESSSSSGSNDVATKAGIALGVLGGLFVIIALVYFMIVRRRKHLEAQGAIAADDEKMHGPMGDHSLRPLTAPGKAPRVSLGPMTGLFNFSSANHGDALASRQAPDLGPRPTTSDSSNASDNPFSNRAQIQDDGLAPAPVRRASAISMDNNGLPPVLTKDLPRSPPRSIAEVSPIESEQNVPVGQAITTARESGATLSAMERHTSERRQSVRNSNVPAPLDLTLPPSMPYTVPPSPAGTEFSMSEMDPDQSPYASAGAASIAADGGPSNTTVHRVQLDFKPTLDDELELQAGQVVRLLHEYDDGWALCIRLDRSKQGVVPRSCLSTRPLKPRHQAGGHRGPPVNPHSSSFSHAFSQGAKPMGPPSGQRGPGPMRPTGPGTGPGPRPQVPMPRPEHTQQDFAETQPSPSEAHLPGQAY